MKRFDFHVENLQHFFSVKVFPWEDNPFLTAIIPWSKINKKKVLFHDFSSSEWIHCERKEGEDGGKVMKGLIIQMVWSSWREAKVGMH